MSKELIGQLAPEEIQKLKDANKADGIYAIEVGGHIGYFRNPNLDDLNFAASQVDVDAPLDFNKTIMNETQIAGSQEITKDFDLFMGASKVVSKRIDGAKASLVEL